MPRSETLPSHCKKLFVHENLARSGFLTPEQHLVNVRGSAISPFRDDKLFVHENHAGSGYLAPEQHLVDLPFSDTAQFRDDKIFVYEKLKQLAAKFANVIKKDKLFEQNILSQKFRTRKFFVRLAE